jgi:hypothetical protein
MGTRWLRGAKQRAAVYNPQSATLGNAGIFLAMGNGLWPTSLYWLSRFGWQSADKRKSRMAEKISAQVMKNLG